jgi:hypothetical protein
MSDFSIKQEIGINTSTFITNVREVLETDNVPSIKINKIQEQLNELDKKAEEVYNKLINATI